MLEQENPIKYRININFYLRNLVSSRLILRWFYSYIAD